MPVIATGTGANNGARPPARRWTEARCEGAGCHRLACRVARDPEDDRAVIVEVKCSCKQVNTLRLTLPE